MSRRRCSRRAEDGEGGAEEWGLEKSKRADSRCREEGADAGVPGAVVIGGEVADFEIDGAIGEDLLGVAVRGDDGAEGFVAIDEELEGVAQRVGIRGAAESEGDGLVVDAGGEVAGVEEGPEAALGGGDGKGD